MARKTLTKISSTANETKLSARRKQIKAIDERLLRLVAERLSCARAIGKLKSQSQLPVKDYRVEKEVLKTNSAIAKAVGVYEDLAHDLTRTLIKYSVIVQDEERNSRRKIAQFNTKTVLLIGGLGQMGQWFAHFFETLGHHVLVFDQASEKGGTRNRAKKKSGSRSVNYEVVSDFHEAVERAQVVVLASPISKTARLLAKLRDEKCKALIFDICSLKSPIISEIRKCEKVGMLITSIHPMFGPAVQMLSGRNIVICEGASKKAALQASILFKETSAQIIHVPLKDHDRYIAYVLGLSHFCNLVFAKSLSHSGLKLAKLMELSSTTFQRQMAVTEPVVKENPDLYFEIQAENNFSTSILSDFLETAKKYSSAILGGQRQEFIRYMATSKKYFEK